MTRKDIADLILIFLCGIAIFGTIYWFCTLDVLSR